MNPLQPEIPGGEESETTVLSNLERRFRKNLDNAIEKSPRLTVSSPRIEPGIVPTIVTGEEEGRNGQLPFGRQQGLVRQMLQGRPMQEPLRVRQTHEVVPEEGEIETTESREVVPFAQMVLFLDADIATFLSPEKRNLVTKRAIDYLRTMQRAAKDLPGKNVGTNGIDTRVYARVHTVAGTDLIPLYEGFDGMGIRSDEDFDKAAEKMSERYYAANQRVIGVNESLHRSNIRHQNFRGDTLGVDNMRWMAERFPKWIEGKIHYFPVTAVVELNAETFKETAFPGRKIDMTKENNWDDFIGKEAKLIRSSAIVVTSEEEGGDAE